LEKRNPAIAITGISAICFKIAILKEVVLVIIIILFWFVRSSLI
jgi:hypothetical protein